MSNQMSVGGKLVDAMFSSETFQLTFENLYSRWQDESGYEDINDYRKILAKFVPTGLTFVKMTKRPFGMTLSHDDKQYVISISRSQLSWKRTK